MEPINIKNYGEEVVIHYGKHGHKINAETFAYSILHLTNALKDANRLLNPGHDIEVYIHALSEGSFRAWLKVIHVNTNKLLKNQAVQTVMLSVLANYIYQQTIAPESKPIINIDDTQVVIEYGNQTIIVPKEVHEAQKEVMKSESFRKNVAQIFEAVENDSEVESFGFVDSIDSPKPDVEINRKHFSLLSQPVEIENNKREKEETLNLEITRAILEKSKRKWEFAWKGIKFSAPVLDEQFYQDFSAHKITVAPGDVLVAKVKIYQKREEVTGVFLNQKYEVLQVIEHIQKLKQPDMY